MGSIAERFCDFGESVWVTASMIGKGRCAPFSIIPQPLKYNLSKSAERLIQGSQLVLDTSRCVDFSNFLWAASNRLLIISPSRLPVGEFRHPRLAQVSSKLPNEGLPHVSEL
jgi:hypothetical protein